MNIPKIIHHIAPKDQSRWHPLWNYCDQSWHKHFVNFEHMYWDDDELENLIKTSFTRYYNVYKSFPRKILNYDFVRPCLLNKFGGIYADMDMYCYKNFFDNLKSNICLLGDTHFELNSQHQISHVTVGNCLMCSEPDHTFWIECIDNMLDLFDYYAKRNVFKNNIDLFANQNAQERMAAFAVLKMGSENIANTFNNNLQYYLSNIQLLPSKLYDSDFLEYKPEFYTKHLYTGTWDQAYVDSVDQYKFANSHYQKLKGVDIKYIIDNIIR